MTTFGPFASTIHYVDPRGRTWTAEIDVVSYGDIGRLARFSIARGPRDYADGQIGELEPFASDAPPASNDLRWRILRPIRRVPGPVMQAFEQAWSDHKEATRCTC